MTYHIVTHAMFDSIVNQIMYDSAPSELFRLKAQILVAQTGPQICRDSLMDTMYIRHIRKIIEQQRQQ